MNFQTEHKFDIESHVRELARGVRAASRKIAHSTTEQRNCALLSAAEAIGASTDEISGQNRIDIEAAGSPGSHPQCWTGSNLPAQEFS